MPTSEVGRARFPLMGGFALLSLASLCATVAAAPLHGTLEAGGPLTVEGETAIVGPHALFLAPALVHEFLFRVTADRAVVRHYESSTIRVGGGYIEDLRDEGKLVREDVYEKAEIVLSHPTMGAFLAASGAKGRSEAHFETSESLLVQTRPPGSVYLRGAYDLEEDSLSMALGKGRIAIAGDFELHAGGVRVHAQGSQSARVYDTGERSSRTAPLAYEHRETWVVATITGGSLTFSAEDAASRAVLYVGSLAAAVDGVISLRDATGSIESPGYAYKAGHQTAILGGTLTLHAAPHPPAGAATHLPGSDAPRLKLALSGDLEHTNLKAIRMLGQGAVARSEAETAVLALGAGVIVGRFVFAFYCRIRPEAVLGNATRRRLLDVAGARPGLSLRETAREVGVSKTTAHYHLRVLAQFGFLLLSKDRPGSRTVRVFVLKGGTSSASDLRSRALTVALSHEPCQRLATAFLEAEQVAATGEAAPEASPGASMSLAEAARRTGLPKATAWRHLRALAGAGVLRATGDSQRGRRYVLSPMARSALEGMGALLAQPSVQSDNPRVMHEH